MATKNEGTRCLELTRDVAMAKHRTAEMNQNADKFTLVPVNAEFLSVARKNSTIISERNERREKEIMEIRDLDTAIREMELELKVGTRCLELIPDVGIAKNRTAEMNQNADKLTLVPVDAELLSGARKNSTRITERNERTEKEIMKIRDLDLAIRKMELELKTVRAETLDLQSKNREELKAKLLSESRAGRTVAKNNRRFLELFGDREFCEKSENEICVANEPGEALSITDEEKRRLVYLTNEGNFDGDDSIADSRFSANPYSSDESSRQLLNKMKKKLENSNDETEVY